MVHGTLALISLSPLRFVYILREALKAKVLFLIATILPLSHMAILKASADISFSAVL